MTFIVRASIDEKGRLYGLIHHVHTGRKERFMGAAQLGEQITTMTAARGDATPGLARLEDGRSGQSGPDDEPDDFKVQHNDRRRT
jgi:hypothetical protein